MGSEASFEEWKGEMEQMAGRIKVGVGTALGCVRGGIGAGLLVVGEVGVGTGAGLLGGDLLAPPPPWGLELLLAAVASPAGGAAVGSQP